VGLACIPDRDEPNIVSLSLRDLQRKVAVLRNASPDIVMVRGCSAIVFPGADAAISQEDLLNSISCPYNGCHESSSGGIAMITEITSQLAAHREVISLIERSFRL